MVNNITTNYINLLICELTMLEYEKSKSSSYLFYCDTIKKALLSPNKNFSVFYYDKFSNIIKNLNLIYNLNEYTSLCLIYEFFKNEKYILLYPIIKETKSYFLIS